MRDARLNIVGSGPVALAFALFAARQGFGPERLRLARFDAPPAATLAGRPLAMSAGSWQLLRRIAGPPQAAPIERVEVTVLGHPGRTLITAAGLGVPALGYVLRYADLLGVLQQAAARAALRGVDPEPEVFDRDGVRIPARSEDVPHLTVHAEGDTGEDAARREFAQSALLAEVEVEPAHGTTAYECFTSDGPLALLPLPQAHRYALVWCDRPEDTRHRAELSPQALAQALQVRFGWPLGRLAIASRPLVAPMIRKRRRIIVDAQQVWIGNAAQALHPVAGQGLNLGLRDAFVLARALGDADARGDTLADALRRYEAGRMRDRGMTIGLTDTLARGFGVSALRPVQSAALALLDALAPARDALARQLMFGLRD